MNNNMHCPQRSFCKDNCIECSFADKFNRMQKEIDKVKTVKTTTMTDGVTECCGYDFGTDGFTGKVHFCPICGRKIL